MSAANEMLLDGEVEGLGDDSAEGFDLDPDAVWAGFGEGVGEAEFTAGAAADDIERNARGGGAFALGEEFLGGHGNSA